MDHRFCLKYSDRYLSRRKSLRVTIDALDIGKLKNKGICKKEKEKKRMIRKSKRKRTKKYKESKVWKEKIVDKRKDKERT